VFPVIVGVNHCTAPLEVREKFNFSSAMMDKALKELRAQPSLQGAVILSTCNRMEIYAVTTEIEMGISLIKDFLSRYAKMDQQELGRYLYIHTLYDTVRHLLRVVSGLNSMILGETQILGQVAQAYETANQAGVSNKVIHVLFQNALAIGKRVRSETRIDQHPVSISYTAVELAKQCFGDLGGKSIMVLGAGEMSALTAQYLVEAGATMVMVSNRSYDRAVALAAELQGEAVRFSEIERVLPEIDIVISATASPRFILLPPVVAQVMALRPEKPLLLIDIALPRDIHPEVRRISGVTLYDIDDLRGVVDSHHALREAAAKQAETIIEEEMIRFLTWHNSLSVVPTIATLKERAHEIKENQLEQAIERLGTISPKQEKIIRSLANSLINQLLHTPITKLKEAAATSQGHLYAEILQNLFDLDVRGEEERKQPSPKQRGSAE
jgi:glutamyl-tRNA reductase